LRVGGLGQRRLRVMLSVALLASLIPLQGAEAYPQATSGCAYGPGTLSYRFIDTTDEFDDEIAWDDDSRDLARDAFDRISDALDDRGNPLANVSEEAPATYDIVLRDGTLGMSVGSTRCTGVDPRIWINADLLTSTEATRDVARRSFGSWWTRRR